MNIFDAPYPINENESNPQRLQAPWESCAHGVVSLLDLLKFNAHDFIMVSRKISWIETIAEGARKTNPGAMHLPLPGETFSEMREGFIGMKENCHALLLDSAEDQVARLINLTDSKPTVEQTVNALTELQNRIDDQLARRSFYQLRPEVAFLFEEPYPFGEQVAAKFPSAAHDIAEACKCYACERYDAVVYHLSRAMESPLRCLASTLHVKYTPGWAAYLNKIDKKLKDSKRRLSRERREFLSNASALLWAVKDAWRNDAAHLEKQYGPDQTRRIFDSTQAFMKHLSLHLKEKVSQ